MIYCILDSSNTVGLCGLKLNPLTTVNCPLHQKITIKGFIEYKFFVRFNKMLDADLFTNFLFLKTF